MGNYDKMAEMAAGMFLEQDQEALLRRYPLEHDDAWIEVVFLGDEYRIDRKQGSVHAADGSLATPQQALIVLDMVCNRVGAPQATGTWRTTAEVSGAVSSVSTAALFESRIASWEGRADELAAECAALGGREVPGGEVSFVFDLFEGFPVWLQFWDADEEFPAQMTFLWDSSTAFYLHYETLWYVMFEILDRLAA